MAIHHLAIALEALNCAPNRLRRELFGGVDSLTEPGDGHMPFQGDRTVMHQQASRVGSAVDGGHRCAHSNSDALASPSKDMGSDPAASCSATQRPTGSSPPVRYQA